ncbi:hypothetical protein [Klenkia taihuensis]|uniref:Primosomal protein n=1 Tax=Klenkia taihuensis TaxID=1225127 RepID=A0A1I1JSS5_9ACTN|nr:hypothetical protein [Klenkia taihuensis]GHE10713.1 hypothetical protein GCM10011381_21060 [Klenkia taihuensis]SFC51624.1 hypothetical protein SAMN05661030_1175 [Klenkia taihuensis]
MARPSIVPIALTLDDRTGYTLWAPPWEEDGEEWQAFLGGSVDGTAVVHLFPTPAALAAFCRTSTDHDLADHPVWPVVAGLGPADVTPDDDHRYDLDGVYDVVAENPDRWAVDELAATFDITGRLAECCDTAPEDDDEDEDEDDEGTTFESLAELMAKPEVALLGLGLDAFTGRSGEDAWIRLGSAVDELWEDVLGELEDHLDWTGAGTAELSEYPSAEEAEADDEDLDDEVEDAADDEDDTAADDAVAAPVAAAPTSAISSGGRFSADPAAVAAAAGFWEGVGILPVEVVVPEGAGLTLRCYVEDTARFLGADGEVYLFGTPAELTAFVQGDEEHDLADIASWPEVEETTVSPLPVDQDRYDLVEVAEVLAEVADGAAGLVDHAVLVQAVEGVRDLAEYAGLARVEELLGAGTPLGQAVARAERDPRAALRAEDAARLTGPWDELVREVSTALVFRD